jgi:ribonucleoside-diphosphate reductase alpha chain
VPGDLPFAAFQDDYWDAWRSGCNGGASYRPNAITGSVLMAADLETPQPATDEAAAIPGSAAP